MQEDCNGFYRIAVNADRCVECHLCEQHCHILHPEHLRRNDARKVQPLAGWSTNEEIIRRSASGGIFAQLAHDMLGDGNTYVYGAALQTDNSVRHIEISSREELPLLQNSKYQQSYTAGIYRQVKQRLKEGARVLFSGVPCQVAGLYVYLHKHPELLEHLYTSEVLCHGVPTCELHRQALKIEDARRIVSYRTKEGTGWTGNNNRLTYEMNDGRIVSKKKHVHDFLFRAYLQFSYTRENCFQCPYSAIDRVSDVTLGDFWGWNKSRRKEEYNNRMGVSIIFPNSAKGREMLAQSAEMHTVTADWREILPLNQNLFMPTNDYLYAGYRHIHRIRRWPLFLQRFIYQNGFDNRYLNEAYRRLMGLLLWPKHYLENRERQRRMKETLKYLNQE